MASAVTNDFDHSSEPSQEGSVQIVESHRPTFSIPSSDDKADTEDEEKETLDIESEDERPDVISTAGATDDFDSEDDNGFNFDEDLFTLHTGKTKHEDLEVVAKAPKSRSFVEVNPIISLYSFDESTGTSPPDAQNPSTQGPARKKARTSSSGSSSRCAGLRPSA